MILERGHAAARRAFARAVRAGTPVTLTARMLQEAARDGVPPEDLVPLAHALAEDVPAEARVWTTPGLDPVATASAAPGARGAKREADPVVTVLLPAARGRPLGLDALRAQDLRVQVRVLANGRDARAIAAACGPEGQVVRWEGHGPTRAHALAEVTTPYVLFTVDDALPLGAGFVRRLVEALESSGFAAVSARQVPWPDADGVTRARLRAWTPPRPTDPGSRGAAVAPWHTIDHVCALYRTDALRQVPLPPVEIGEDWVWARRARAAGLRVGLAGGVPVLHSHPPDAVAVYRRTRALHAVMRAEGEPPAVRGWGDVLRNLPGAAWPGVRRGELRAALCGVAEVVGQGVV